MNWILGGIALALLMSRNKPIPQPLPATASQPTPDDTADDAGSALQAASELPALPPIATATITPPASNSMLPASASFPQLIDTPVEQPLEFTLLTASNQQSSITPTSTAPTPAPASPQSSNAALLTVLDPSDKVGGWNQWQGDGLANDWQIHLPPLNTLNLSKDNFRIDAVNVTWDGPGGWSSNNPSLYPAALYREESNGDLTPLIIQQGEASGNFDLFSKLVVVVSGKDIPAGKLPTFKVTLETNVGQIAFGNETDDVETFKEANEIVPAIESNLTMDVVKYGGNVIKLLINNSLLFNAYPYIRNLYIRWEDGSGYLIDGVQANAKINDYTYDLINRVIVKNLIGQEMRLPGSFDNGNPNGLQNNLFASGSQNSEVNWIEVIIPAKWIPVQYRNANYLPTLSVIIELENYAGNVPFNGNVQQTTFSYIP